MNRSIRKASTLLVFMLIVLMCIGAVSAATGPDVSRIAGANRYETSAKVALDAYDSADTVIIARGDDEGGFADGLAASVLAGALDAPVLLTAPARLPDVIAAAIEDLGATKAYVLGGTGAVSDAVLESLEELALEVERIAGDNRFDTAAQVAAVAKAEGDLANFAFVVNGYSPADSLVAAPAAFRDGCAILQVNKDSIPDVTKEAVDALDLEKIYIVGGSGVVSVSVENELKELVTTVKRLAGDDRFGTSVAVAEEIFPNETDFVLAGGRDVNLADSIGAGVFGQPLLYVQPAGIPPAVKAYLDDNLNADSSVIVLGGEAVVGEAVTDEVEEIIDEAVAALETAIAAAEAAIEELPEAEAVTLEDAADIAVARALVDDAVELGAVEADIAGIEALEAAEAALADLEEALVDAVAAAENAIAALPGEVTLDDAADIAAARALVDAAVELGAVEADIVGIEDLEAAEAALTDLEADLADAVAAAEAAIADLPETVTLEDAADIAAARDLVEAAEALGAVEADIVGIEDLEAAEAALAVLKEEQKEAAIAEAIVKIDAIGNPGDLTLGEADMARVADARDAVEAAIALGAVDGDIVNLDHLLAAEAAIDGLENLADAIAAADSALAALPEGEELAEYDDLAALEALVKAATEAVAAAGELGAQDADFGEGLLARLTQANARISELTEAADQAAADAVKALIDELPEVAKLTLGDAEDVAAARDAYEALTDAQQALVSNIETLNTAEEKIEELKDKAAAIQEANAAIRALPLAANITLAHQEQVEAARELVETAVELGAAENEDFPNLWKLVAAEARVQALEADQVAADAVKALITALPAVDELTLDDAEDVAAARAAYDGEEGLTDAQKALVDNLATLVAAENKIAELKLAKAIADAIAKITAIGDPAELTIDDLIVKDGEYYIEVVSEARTAVEAVYELDESATIVNLDHLLAAEDRVVDLGILKDAIAEADAALEALPEEEELAEYAYEDLAALEALVEDAATAVAEARGLGADDDSFGVGLLAKLTTANNKIEELKAAADLAAATAVKALIAALPAVDNLTLDNADAVADARAAYDALTEAQKALMDNLDDNLDKLVAAETRIEALEDKAEAIAEANAALTALPITITLAEKEQVEEARGLVEAAVEKGAIAVPEDEQESDFPNLWKLIAAEKKIADLTEVSGSIARDPGNTGGDLTVTVENDTVTFSGEIKWYEANKDLDRAAGNRVGVQINAPEGFEAKGAKVTIGEKTYDNLFASKDYFWWYPLVTEAGETFTATVRWNSVSTQVFTVKISENATLDISGPLAAVNAINGTAADIAVIKDNAKILGLDLEAFNALDDKTGQTGGRQTAVMKDLASNKPNNKGYDQETLKAVFDSIVAVRTATQASMDLVNEAESLEDIAYVEDLLTAFKGVAEGHINHSGQAISEKVTALEGLVANFEALPEVNQKAALSAVITNRPDGGYLRSQSTLDALTAAIAEQSPGE